MQLIVFLLGFFYAILYYARVDEPVNFNQIARDAVIYFSIIGLAAFAIGAINLTRIHWRNVSGRRPNRPYSFVLLVGMYAMFVFGAIASPFRLDPTASVFPEGLIATFVPVWEFAYYRMYVPAQAMLFALLGFYIASAAYRAFRAKTLDSTIMLVSGVLIILGMAPAIELFLPGIDQVRNWILEYPNTAGQRGILLGISLGIIAFSFERLIAFRRKGE
jgi:hypothetical protein